MSKVCLLALKMQRESSQVFSDHSLGYESSTINERQIESLTGSVNYLWIVAIFSRVGCTRIGACQLLCRPTYVAEWTHQSQPLRKTSPSSAAYQKHLHLIQQNSEEPKQLLGFNIRLTSTNCTISEGYWRLHFNCVTTTKGATKNIYIY